MRANTLAIKSMATVVAEAKQYINDRHTGVVKSLKVASKRVNETFMDGFDWNRILTIGGLSGNE